MFSSYLKIALRNFQKQKGYSVITILGLAIGISVCLVIILYVRQELSFDRFNERSVRIVRVIYNPVWGGSERSPSIYTPTILAPLFGREFPEVETAVRFFDSFGPVLVSRGAKVFQEGRFYFADSTVFSVFSFHILAGTPEELLNRPSTVVLTRSMAVKYFGEENPLGKTVILNNRAEYEITGVMEDVPKTSHVQFDFLASFSSLSQWANREIWSEANFYTYLLLREGVRFEEVQRKSDEILKRAAQASGQSSTFTAGVILEPLRDVYLHSPYTIRNQPDGNWASVLTLSAVAALILAIACINYMNLATARSQRRAREVGIRKTVGASMGQIASQFFAESGLITLVAIFVAMVFSEMALPWVNSLLGTTLELNYLEKPVLLPVVGVIWLSVSFAAGSYPALFLASVRPGSILKPLNRMPGAAASTRKVLVTFQFAISFFLMVGISVLYEQLEFMRSKELGFDKEQVVAFRISDPLTVQSLPTLHAELTRLPGYLSAATAAVPLVNVTSGYGVWKEGMPADRSETVTAFAADHRYIQTMRIQLLEGKGLPEVHPADTSWYFVLNESAVRLLGWTPAEAVGKTLRMSGSRIGMVTGVMKDFHVKSLHKPIEPFILFNSRQAGYTRDVGYLLVRLTPGDLTASLAALEQLWNKVVPHRPFQFTFLDDDLEALYRTEQRLGELLSVFTALAIFIACLGLYALAAFTAEQRTKEMGIRKVLGASASMIVGLLSKDFLRLVTIGFLVGGPFAYTVLTEWLQNFNYRIDLSLFNFVLAGFAIVMIAFLTVGFQALKAALANPVEALRYE